MADPVPEFVAAVRTLVDYIDGSRDLDGQDALLELVDDVRDGLSNITLATLFEGPVNAAVPAPRYGGTDG